MEITILIKDKHGFELKLRSKTLIAIVAINKILGELKDVESLGELEEQNKIIKGGK
jgi:hypothetical protein